MKDNHKSRNVKVKAINSSRIPLLLRKSHLVNYTSHSELGSSSIITKMSPNTSEI